MNANRITLISLGVANVAASARFYSALGWTPEMQNVDVAFYDLGGQKFGLYDRAKLAADLGRTAAALGTGAMTLAQNFASEADVDTAYADALAAGATPCRPPEQTAWGGYSGTWCDPDGHVWEYAFNPFWALDSSGRIA